MAFQNTEIINFYLLEVMASTNQHLIFIFLRKNKKGKISGTLKST